MDPSSWVNYTAQHYSRLRASGNQMNHQLNCPPGLNVGQSGHQLNVNDHLGIGVTASATNQAMSGHYGHTSAAHPHSWLFSSHGLNAATHQTPTHDSSSFNANPFLHHPSYDSSFLSAQFPSKASYLPTGAVGTNFFNQMKKADNDMNSLRNAAYCQTMSGMSGMTGANNINNMTGDPNGGLATGSLFPSHLTPSTWRHHSNLMASNSSNAPFGILPHEAVNSVNAVNVMNNGSNGVGSGHSHSSHASHTPHSSHSSHSSHNSSHHSSSSHNKSSNESSKGHHFHHLNHKTSAAMPGMSSAVDNSFRNIMPSLPPTQSSHAIPTRAQNSFDASVGAKITAHHHHSQPDPYATGMFAMAAAAHAMGSDYASMQTQRYASGIGSGMASGNQQAMTAFASNTASRSAYPSVGFHSDASARSRELLSSSSLLQSSKQGSNSCNARNMSAMNAMNAMNAGSYLSNCAMMPMMNTSAQSVVNYSSSPAHTVNSVISNSLAPNQSVSRSSSSASNHGLQQGNDSSCSFGYGSPATTLPQSPYPQPQRSNTSNSSQGTPTATGAAVQSSAQDYSNYGTPQGFPSMGTQTPTPTPGYPTPPSSVGQPHVTPANSQGSTTHEEQVSHYPQLTPQTPTQSTQFSANYSNFGSNAKMSTNGNQTSDSILTNSSSCMVAAAAVANMQNSSQNSSSVVSQRPSSGYLIPGASIHESEPESCGLSSMVGVNPMSDNITNAKLNDLNHVIGGSTEPTLNSVFSSQEIDFPIISFGVNDETTNAFNNKKKSKNSKKNRKRDRNKNNNNNITPGLAVDQNNAFAYQYPAQQYQNSYPNPNPYVMPQNIGHHNQTAQESQPTHNIIPNDSSAADTHTNANSCYDMQYQHLAQPQQPVTQQTQQTSHPTPEHDLMQHLPHEPLHQTVQTQEHPLIEPVISVASQQLTQTPTTSVAEKQSFPTIDDELSFLTEPTDCVSMETQTPNMNTSAQMETHSPLVLNQSSNICSERSNANCSPNSNGNHNSNSNQGNNSNSSQPSGFLKSFMTFINSPTGATTVVPKEKKKKKVKPKESNENKVKQNTINGQKSCKFNKKSKFDDNFDSNEEMVFMEQKPKNNFSAINQNTPKLISGENVVLKKSTTGDRENYESKFFKRRPSTNINTNTVHIIEMDSRKDVKNGKKRKNKMNFDLFGNDSQRMHDEYEFPDSPPNTHNIKKSRKSSSSDIITKKRTAPDFEKMISPSVNINFKKNNNKKNNVLTNPSKPLVTSSTESIENSINSVALNTGLTHTPEDTTVQTVPQNPIKEIAEPKPLTVIPVPEPPVPLINDKKPNCVSNQTNNKKQTQNQVITKKSPNLKTSPTTTTNSMTSLTTITTSTIAIEDILGTISTTAVSTTPNTTNTTPQTTTTTTNSSVLTNNCNSSQASVGMQSAGTNTPRRRSQDKKASTIREGMMRTGDFVVSIDESQYDLPVIWRIEGKSLLQRFEPTEQEDITVYINTSSYSAWNPTVRQRYIGVDVRIMGCSRTRIVVEKLGLTQTNANTLNGLASIERVSAANKANSGQTSNTFQHQENFEVFIQTLISQALDPNFISEIVKENDEYFLSHVQAIDDVCSRKKSRFFSKVKWDANIVKCVETYPLFTVTAQNNVGDLRCRLCHDNWSTQILQFAGEPYNQMTLEVQTGVDLKQTKYAACDPCTEKIVLYSHLHHQKHNFFNKCKDKVQNMRAGDESKESHVILEHCLQDSEWINTLFKELEEIWNNCDKIR